MSIAGAFAEWQPRYAKHGVALFPINIVGADKKPAIQAWNKVGLRGSEQLAIKFPTASAFAFNCGRHNRVTVVDMDSTDEAIVREGERLFGPSPLLWRTGNGKFAAAYRHNGEGRWIRSIPSLPIDLLGAGPCVAPGSMGAKRPYELIRGSLDDLDRLPVARIPGEITCGSNRQPLANLIPDGERHLAVFRQAHKTVARCDDLHQLVDAVRTWAQARLEKGKEPVSDAYIVRTCDDVWRYREGRKRIGTRMLEEDIYKALAREPVFAGVFAVLAAENGPDSEFMITDTLGKKWGWPKRLLPAARDRMLELGVIERVGRRHWNGPWVYRWRLPSLLEEGNDEAAS